MVSPVTFGKVPVITPPAVLPRARRGPGGAVRDAVPRTLRRFSVSAALGTYPVCSSDAVALSGSFSGLFCLVCGSFFCLSDVP